MKNSFWNSRQILAGVGLGFFFFLFLNVAQAQLSATELDRIFASDVTQSDHFGWSVDVDGDRAVIGAPKDDDDVMGANTGAAYVFLRNAQTGVWEQEAKLVMSGMSAYDEFGTSVAISDNVIVVGAPYADTKFGTYLHGSAHVFTFDSGSWDSGVELTTGTADVIANYWENFGISVDIDGGRIVVGVSFDDNKADNSGSAFVFERSNQNWLVAKRLFPTEGGSDQNFGFSVAIDRETVIVGAPHWTDSGIGEAYIFRRGNDSWPTNGTKLLPTDNLSEDHFGWSVDLDGDLAVVGARYDDDAVLGEDAGSISIFRQSAGLWSLQEKLTASNGEAGDYFGFAVATNGDAVAVGATKNGGFGRGSVYLFSDSGSGWMEDEMVFPVKNSLEISTVSQFGSGVAFDYGTLIAGARTSDVYDGSAYQWVAGAAFFYGVNATSIYAATSENQLVIKAPTGSYLSDVGAFDPESLATLPPATVFPLGAVGFTVNGLTPGAAIEVELSFPDTVGVSGFYKFSDHWYRFPYDGTTGAILRPGLIRLRLVDGGRGDHDGLVNGVIVDPGGPFMEEIVEVVFKDGFE